MPHGFVVSPTTKRTLPQTGYVGLVLAEEKFWSLVGIESNCPIYGVWIFTIWKLEKAEIRSADF